MMAGWLSRGSQRGESLMSRLRGSSPLKDKEVDAAAGFETFRTHWQQAWDMMQTHQDPDAIGTDEVNCVLNHVDQVITLLLWDLKCSGDSSADDADPTTAHPGDGGLRIFDLFLSERVLERLLEWSGRCGQYEDLLRLEQLRVYEQLLRQSAGALLAHRAVLRPLTQLLASCRQAEPVELHRRLVLVLGHLCAALHRRPALLDLFVSLEPDGSASSFVVFSMLVDFVHRDGVIGQTAREALLQCMRLSSGNDQLAQYIVQHSNFCPVLATGLSGLYSVLPRKLPVISEDRYQLLSSHSKQVPELHSFVSSLDFCNSVLQVCHPLIAEQLLDYVYQGFLVSVMGPALHQLYLSGQAARSEVSCLRLPVMLQNSVEEIITATAYLDLFLRSIDHAGLVRAFLRLILAQKYDERRIIDSLVQRIAATSKLCVVTLSLLHTLLDLNCEDVMLELVFRHLLPCTHVMVSQRPQVRHPDLYGTAAHRLLALVPACCASQPQGGVQTAPPGSGPASPSQRAAAAAATAPVATAAAAASAPAAAADTAPVQFALQSPMSSYFEYVMDARVSVRACHQGCATWTYTYDGANPSPAQVYKMTRQRFQMPADDASEGTQNGEAPRTKPSPNGDVTNHVACQRPPSSDASERPAASSATTNDAAADDAGSIGESSGYQSFNPRLSPSPPPEPQEDGLFWALLQRAATPPPSAAGETAEESCRLLAQALGELGVSTDDVDSGGHTESRPAAPSQVTSHPLDGSEEVDRETPQSPTEMFGVTPNVGPFLWLLLEQLEEATTNGFQVNLQLMSVITRLSLFPQPLLRSFLLDHSIVLQPSVRSLIQTLGGLKARIDQATAALPHCCELVQWARGRLAAREEQPASPASSLGAAAPAGSAQAAAKGGRLSLNSVASMLRRSLGGSSSGAERPASNSLEPNPDGSGFRYTRRPPSRSASSAEEAAARRLVLAAVLLEHWLLELAAIVQEHAVAAAEGTLARL